MTLENGFHTRREIFSQPEAWSAALEVLSVERQPIVDLGNLHFDQVIFTGCGSTYYLALAAAALTQELTGRTCRAFPASELWLNPQSSFARATNAAGGGQPFWRDHRDSASLPGLPFGRAW